MQNALNYRKAFRLLRLGVLVPAAVLILSWFSYMCLRACSRGYVAPVSWELAVPDLGGRIAGIEKLFAEPGHDGRPLNVIAGLSTVREGFSPDYLASHSDKPWFVYAKGGSQMGQLAFYLEMLHASSVPVDTLYIGLHKLMLHDQGSIHYSVEDGGGLKAHFNGVRGWYVQLFNLYGEYIKQRAFILRLKLQNLDPLGTRLSFAPEDDPYSVQNRYDHLKSPNEQAKARQRKHWPKYARAQHYEKRISQFLLMKDVQKKFEQDGVRVEFFFMPEGTFLRDLYAGELGELVFSQMRAVAGVDPHDLVSFDDRLPDELFHDYGHLSAAGRAELSRIFLEELGNEQSKR